MNFLYFFFFIIIIIIIITFNIIINLSLMSLPGFIYFS